MGIKFTGFGGGTGKGCGCCGCSITYLVLVCGVATSGVVVTVKSGGTTVATGTTNSSGQVTLTIPGSGTYDVVTSKTGLGTATQTLALSCGVSYTWDYGPGSTSMTLTDANTTLSTGAGTLTYLGGTPRQWRGSYTINITSADQLAYPSCRWLATSVGAVAIIYTVTCNTNGSVQVLRAWLEIDDVINGWTYGRSDGGALCTRNTGSATLFAVPSSYVPFAWSGTLTAATSNHMPDPVGGTVALS